jgi:predicted nucleic acid-binding protein
LSSLVVSDTSPVRALNHLGLLHILQDLFTTVLIPPAVRDELLKPTRTCPVIDISRVPFLRVQAPHDAVRVSSFLAHLDPGEAEALVLALEVQAQVLLLDERKARRVAEGLGLTSIGTLGLLLEAKRQGLVPTVHPLLVRLRDELAFFLSDALLHNVLDLAGEAGP